ncbi:MAG TPA: TIGR04255 family protein [Ktedonobacteraceae bacterium]|nr:TIGR04255 family protein [Ktedonobacteraceae bacterium]
MARIYNKPPLIEAVCDFRFSSSQLWDWTIPGLFYEQIRDNFPNKNQISTIETTVNASEGKVVQQSQPKLQFINQDGTAVIHVGPDNLTIHQLRPYDSWEHFKARILKYLSVYRETAHPENLANVVLRYVNRIDLSKPDFELDDYFRILPQIPNPIPQIFQGFLFNVDVPYHSLRTSLRLVFGTVIPEGEVKNSFLLDLSMFSLNVAIPSMDEVSDWLEAAHKHLEDAFDAAFTERTHCEIFEEMSK